MYYDIPKIVLTRKTKGKRRQRGIPTGSGRICNLEGCSGMRIGVRWPDGKLTFPCTDGMRSTKTDGVWEIV